MHIVRTASRSGRRVVSSSAAGARIDGMLRACHRHDVANLQVKNVPDALFRRIRRLAAQEGQTIRDFVLDAVRAKVAREDFQARLARRTPVQLERSASTILDEARRERDKDLGA
jgi:hypothetical protein